MQIAIFGFYNSLNAGDDRIQEAITHLLGGRGHQLYFLPHHLEPPIGMLKHMDWVLIGGGGLVFSPHGIWVRMRRWMRKIRAKIGVLGLGINQLPDVLRTEIDDLAERSSFFFVRDQRSHDLTGRHPRVRVAPDLTWLIPHALPAGVTVPQRFRFAVNLVPCHWKPFDPDQWMKHFPQGESLPFPFYLTEKHDVGLLRRYFPDVPTQFSLMPLLAAQILVGARFHSIIFALQLGKPFVAIAYDDKVRELCRESGLAEYCLDTEEHELLPERLERLTGSEAAVRERIGEFARRQRAEAAALASSVADAMHL